MNNQGSDRDRRDARSDEAHTDPIGFSVDEGSDFHRRMQGHPQRREPHPRASRNVDREPDREAERGAVPQEVGRSRAASRKDRAASSRKRRGRLVALVLGLVLIVAVAGGGYFAVNKFGNRTTPAS